MGIIGKPERRLLRDGCCETVIFRKYSPSSSAGIADIAELVAFLMLTNMVD